MASQHRLCRVDHANINRSENGAGIGDSESNYPDDDPFPGSRGQSLELPPPRKIKEP